MPCPALSVKILEKKYWYQFFWSRLFFYIKTSFFFNLKEFKGSLCNFHILNRQVGAILRYLFRINNCQFKYRFAIKSQMKFLNSECYFDYVYLYWMSSKYTECPLSILNVLLVYWMPSKYTECLCPLSILNVLCPLSLLNVYVL